MTDSEKPKRKKKPNGTGSYRQRPDGRWEYRVSLPDGKRKSIYGLTYTECKEKVKALLKEHDQGRDIMKRDPTVAAFMVDWFAFVDDGTRAPATIKNYRIHIDRHIVPAIGTTKLSKLTTRHIDDLQISMQRDGRAGGTRRIVRTILKAALNQALRWDMVIRNVADLSQPPVIDSPEREPLNAEQLLALVAHTENHRFGPLYQLAMATGLRQGELLGLRWIDVDLDGRTLEVVQTLHLGTHGREMGKPKTPKSRRTIALPAFAITALKRQLIVQADTKAWAGKRWLEHGLVFTSSTGTPADPDTVTRELRAELNAARLPRTTFHDLRHAAATLLAKHGVSGETRRDMLGHTNSQMTGRYTHIDMDEFRRAADALDAAFLVPPTSTEIDEVAS
jgi:integrase